MHLDITPILIAPSGAVTLAITAPKTPDELRVIKVSTRGLEKFHPSQADIRIKTGCSIVAVERGEDLLVEFGADFHFEPKDSVYICGSAEAAQKFYEIFPQE